MKKNNKKKNKFTVLLITVIFLISASCNKTKDFLDTKPLDEYSAADFWKSPGLVDQLINGMYVDAFYYPYNFTGVSLSNYSGDESWYYGNTGDFSKSKITADLIPFWEVEYSEYTKRLMWQPLYVAIRKANSYFENNGNIKYTNDEQKGLFTGQVYFLRGTFYHYLTSLYGGVPIITKTYGLTDNFEVTRNSYDECINFITGQLDSAALYLPENSNAASGRITKGAALALKSRVLLYAASDLHTKMTNYAPGYSNPELLGYVNANHDQLWQKAKDAAKVVIDKGWYSLYNANPAPGDSIAKSIADYFISRAPASEDILLRNHTATSATRQPGSIAWINHQPYQCLYPNGYHGWGGAMPTADQADAYEMKDGSSFDWNNPAHKIAPYSNRDARFYSTLLFEGSDWALRPSDVRGIDPWNQMQTGQVEYKDGSGQLLSLRGADGGRIDDWSGGVYTGYFLRKGFDPTVDYTATKEDVPYRLIRYAEVLLNYAEACIELGQDAEARLYINMIRKRAGQPDLPASISGVALKQRYQNERRIELAFEEHRFFDVRRWLIGNQAYAPIHKLITKYTTSENINGNYRKTDGSYWSNPSYSIEILDNYAWLNKAYYLPIKSDEISKNAALIQNPGY